MTIESEKLNFEEKIKQDIDNMDELVGTAKDKIGKTEKKIQEIAAQNIISK